MLLQSFYICKCTYATSNEQSKHVIVVILVRPGSDFEKQRNIAISEILADVLDNCLHHKPVYTTGLGDDSPEIIRNL